MNFYPFHLGDYHAHTGHLEPLEDLAYRRMLDAYYLRESALPKDPAEVARLIRMRSNVTEVKAVLDEFFHEQDDGWHHGRCDIEIAKTRKQSANHWAKKLPKHVRAAMQAERNASKAQATPKWLTKSDRAAIAAVYAQAATLTAQTGIRHEVDHIVPLRSPVVCGLHVVWNLKAIPAEKNRAKSNFFEVA